VAIDSWQLIAESSNLLILKRIYQSVESRENLMGVDAKGICSPKTKEELGDP
jgi:hypothetical protein